MQQVKGDAEVNKLILLFVFDKMEMAMSEETLFDMCTSANSWINYMDLKGIIASLNDRGLIYTINNTGEVLYNITTEGRMCLANYFVKIPTSTREEIALFVKNNRKLFRKRQECFADYFMNKDGTFTVHLKIIEPAQPLLEMKLVVPGRNIAKEIYRSWENKAADFYALIYENLVEQE